MGNWMTVQIIGSCAKDDVPALTKEVKYDLHDINIDQEFYCLTSCGGLCGLPLWPAEAINAVGNCAERDYTPESVKSNLEAFAKIAPSLEVKVHCGGDYETKEVIATVTLEKGKATIGKPEIENLPNPPEGQMAANLMGFLGRR